MRYIKEENSEMKNRTYQVPLNIKQFLNTKANEGGQRIVHLLNAPSVTYSQLKRMKVDIESGVYQSDWSPVLIWVNSILGRDRKMVDNQKRTTMEIGMENRFRATHDKNHNKNLTPLTEKKVIKITEVQLKMLHESEIFNIKDKN